MVQYRRYYEKGGIYFFTVNLRDRRECLLVDHIAELRMAFRKTMIEMPFEIIAIVILPDHIHSIWKLPENDQDYSTRWKRIKGIFTKALRLKGVKLLQDKHKAYNLWQRRFWEHKIRDERDYTNHIGYIHYNPVKHGHVEKACEWPYSSFRNYVERGILDEGWGDSSNDLELGAGE